MPTHELERDGSGGREVKRTGEAHSIVIPFVKTVLASVAQIGIEGNRTNRTANGSQHQIFGIADTLVFANLDAVMGAKRQD
jgi:hypothetical protein